MHTGINPRKGFIMRVLLLLIVALLLNGCDKINGLIDTRASDGKAVGYACRMAQKLPNVCMAENPKQAQSYILQGWKKADEEIKDGLADPKMKNELPSESDDTSEDAK